MDERGRLPRLAAELALVALGAIRHEIAAVGPEDPLFRDCRELVYLAKALVAAHDGFVHGANLVHRRPPPPDRR